MDRPRTSWHGHHTERDFGRTKAKASQGGFAAQVLAASAVVAIVAWNAVPVAGSLRTADRSEIATRARNNAETDERPAYAHSPRHPKPAAADLLDDAQPEFAALAGKIAHAERSVYFPNCTAARAAGAAPIDRGSPGYRAELDRDGDGTACEPYR